MKIRTLTVIAALAMLGACNRFDEGQTPEQEPKIPDEVMVIHEADGALPGKLLVKFTPSAADELNLTGGETRGGGPLSSGIMNIDRVLDRISAVEMQRLFPVTKNEAKTRAAGLHLWYELTFDESIAAQEVVDMLRDKVGEISVLEYDREVQPYVDVVPDGPLPTAQPAPQPAAVNSPVDDPYFNLQWSLKNDGSLSNVFVAGSDINILGAWNYSMGSPYVTVCVVDYGVQNTHPDLIDNIWINPDEAAGRDNNDDDRNGYVDDIYGFNFVSNKGLITWEKENDTGHGTHVAGIIGAATNNGIGIAGIAGGSGKKDGVKLMSAQIFDDGKSAGVSGCAKAIKYGADNGAVISQNSWSYSNSAYPNVTRWLASCSAEADAIDFFVEYAGTDDGPIKGGLVFFSAGNDGHLDRGGMKFPAAYEPCIAVASIGPDFKAAYYTDYGTWVDIAATGGDLLTNRTYGGVYSTVPEQNSEGLGYAFKQGTSMACPTMSGIAALAISYVYENGLHITGQKLREILLSCGRNINSYQTGSRTFTSSNVSYTIYYSDYRSNLGSGLIDAEAVMATLAKTDLPSMSKGAPPVITPLDGLSMTVQYNTIGQLRFRITDPDGDDITSVEAVSPMRLSDKNGDVYTVSVSGPSVSAGSYKGTLKATDSKGMSSFVEISYMVRANEAPQYTAPIEDLYMDTKKAVSIDLANHFYDPNNEQLTYEITCSDPDMLYIDNNGGTITINARRYGAVTVRITAKDGGGLSAQTSFNVIVRDMNAVMEFYPVPVKNVLNIRTGVGGEGTLNVKIFNSTGTKVMDIATEVSPMSPAAVDMSKLAPGTYRVEASVGNISEKRNIVKI